LPNGTSAVFGRVTNQLVARCSDNASGIFIKDFYSAFDLIFNDSTNFYKSADPTGIGAIQIDLQTVALHELGHCHLLNHVNQDKDFMYARIGEGLIRRKLNADNVSGGNHVMAISSPIYTGSNCNASTMLPADISGLGCTSSIRDEIKAAATLTFSPNPVTHHLDIKIDPEAASTLNGKQKVRIVNVIGKIIYDSPLTDRKYSIDASSWAPGIYFLYIETDHIFSKPQKFIKI